MENKQNSISALSPPLRVDLIFTDDTTGDRITLKGLLKILRSINKEVFDKNVEEIMKDKHD